MLPKEKMVIVKEKKIRETKNILLILIDKGEIQRLAYIVILQDIVSSPTRKNISRDLQMLRAKLNSRRRPTHAI